MQHQVVFHFNLRSCSTEILILQFKLTIAQENCLFAIIEILKSIFEHLVMKCVTLIEHLEFFID